MNGGASAAAAERRARFDRDGYLVIRGALRPDEVAGAREALDRVYADAARSGLLHPDGSMHLLGAVANCPEVACLTDHPATFPYVWSTRDHNAPMRASGWFGRLNPVQQQLLGGAEAGDGDHAWGHYPDRTPLYEWLNERGLLDPANPPLKP